MKRSGPLKRTSQLKRSPLKTKKKTDTEWVKARKEVISRSSGRCEARWDGCLGTVQHVHHKKLRSQGGGHEMSNLLACCFVCHNLIHANPAIASSKGHLVRIKEDE